MSIDYKKAGFTTVMPFGKYKGKTLQEIISIDASYILWLKKNTSFSMNDSVISRAENDRDEAIDIQADERKTNGEEEDFIW